MVTRTALRRILMGLALAALTAVLFTLAFPPYNAWFLIFVGLVPMVVAQHRGLPARLSGLAQGVGIGGFFWGYFGGMFRGAPWPMRWLPLFIGIVATLVSSLDRDFHERTGYRWFVLQGAAVWVGIEMIRGFVPMIGVWGFAANALYRQPWLIQPVSVFSIYGLSLLILLVNYALALGVLAIYDGIQRRRGTAAPQTRRLARSWLLAVGLIAVAWVGLSFTLLQPPSSHSEATVRVAALHPAFEIQTYAGVEAMFDLTRRAADEGVEVVVWHEGALTFDPQETHTSDFRAVAAETGAHLVIGYAIKTPEGLRNEVTVLTPDGTFLGFFGKDHPVLWGGETSLSRGRYPAYETSLGTLGTIICYDLDFTDTARKVVRNGARLIGVPSRDWPAVARKHYTHLVLRAVENRVPMVKADIGFDSAIIDAYGRILELAVTPSPSQAILIADVPLGPADAPVIRLGDWVGWLCLAAMVAFLIAAVVRPRA